MTVKPTKHYCPRCDFDCGYSGIGSFEDVKCGSCSYEFTGACGITF